MKLKDIMKFFKKPEHDKYNTKELETGEKVEIEHIAPEVPKKITKAIVKNIAKNHLDEIPDYYEKLKKFDKS